MTRRYIIDLWLDYEELAFLGFRLLAVRVNSEGKRELVVEVREPVELLIDAPQWGH